MSENRTTGDDGHAATTAAGGGQVGGAAALQVAAQLFQAGRLDEAAKALEDVRAGDPDNFDATLGLAVVHATRGNLEAAVPLFERAAVIRPGDPEAHFNLARALGDQGRHEEAIAAYRRSLEIEPNAIPCLINLGNLLKDENDLAAAAECYRQVLRIDPNIAGAHNNLGNILKALGNREEAITCFETALELDPEHPGTEMQLRHTRSKLIQHWHFPMLGDETRNDAYQRAIENAVAPGDHVLDIGTGSGLLAMMAARAGAARVTACEKLAPLARAARQVIEDNGFADRITVVAKSSDRLRVGVDLERPADVLVSEIVDEGLLREGVLPTLRHAVRHLAAPGATLVPKSAEIKAVLVEAPSLRRVNPIRTVAGFDLSAMDQFHDLGYQTVILKNVEHRRVSDVFTAARFDFADLPGAPADRHRAVHTVEAVADGNAHAVVYWFVMHLDDETTLTNDPETARTHWAQAMQFLDRDLPVARGAPIEIGVTWSDLQISFAL